MSQVKINTPAPDFELPRFDGGTVRLSDIIQDQHIVLVFNRGFT